MPLIAGIEGLQNVRFLEFESESQRYKVKTLIFSEVRCWEFGGDPFELALSVSARDGTWELVSDRPLITKRRSRMSDIFQLRYGDKLQKVIVKCGMT